MATTTTTPRRRRYITRKFLVERGACNEQLALFDKHFPKGRVLVTQDKAEEYANLFSFDWMVSHLAGNQRRLFWKLWDTALKEFHNSNKELADYERGVKLRARAWAEAFLISEQQQPESRAPWI